MLSVAFRFAARELRQRLLQARIEAAVQRKAPVGEAVRGAADSCAVALRIIPRTPSPEPPGNRRLYPGTIPRKCILAPTPPPEVTGA